MDSPPAHQMLRSTHLIMRWETLRLETQSQDGFIHHLSSRGNAGRSFAMHFCQTGRDSDEMDLRSQTMRTGRGSRSWLAWTDLTRLVDRVEPGILFYFVIFFGPARLNDDCPAKQGSECVRRTRIDWISGSPPAMFAMLPVSSGETRGWIIDDGPTSRVCFSSSSMLFLHIEISSSLLDVWSFP